MIQSVTGLRACHLTRADVLRGWHHRPDTKTRNLVSLIIMGAEAARVVVSTGFAIVRAVKGKPKDAAPGGER